MKSRQEILTMICELSDAYGVSGFEDEVITKARRWIDEQVYTLDEDKMRNLLIRAKTNTHRRPAMLLDAHSDELGFIIQAIKPNGTLTFLPLGGWVSNTLAAQKVKVRNAKGEYISGVIAAKPVHFMNDAERNKNVEISSMVIDVGATSEKQAIEEFGMRIGEPVVCDVRCEIQIDKGIIMGKALDCRIGVAALIQTLEILQSEPTELDLLACLSSQEEIGDRGIKTVMNQIHPQIAICFEGCPADDTFMESWQSQSAIDKGPMLRHMDRSVICNPRYMRYSLDLAASLKIPVQSAVRSGGGNNGAVIQLSDQGIPTIVLGIPVRYIHSHHGICSLHDFDSAVKLAVALVKHLNQAALDTF